MAARLARDLHSQYPNSTASVLEGLGEMFTRNELGISAELARTMVTANLIENPNSVGTVRAKLQDRWVLFAHHREIQP